MVLEARRALAATGHGASALAAGSYEWTARASALRRSVRDAGNSDEWSAQLERGVRIGSKAALDRQIGDADIAVAQARIGVARHEFPDAPLEPVALGDPADPMWTEVQWRERVAATAAVLRVASIQVRKAELIAARANADKVPDPTLGVFTSSEAFRSERVVGISISIPLSGIYRDELMRQSLQEADVARAALDRERQAIDIEIAETHADAVGGVARWRAWPSVGPKLRARTPG